MDQLDLQSFCTVYDSAACGRPPKDPRVLVSPLPDADCIGVRFSRKLEAATYDRMSFRYETANQHSDLGTIVAFCARHPADIERFIITVLDLCVTSGVMQVDVVANDGTRLRAIDWKWQTKTWSPLAGYLAHQRKLVASIFSVAAQQDLLDTDGVQDQNRNRAMLAG